jgi:type I restriction enzyme R subunit
LLRLWTANNRKKDRTTIEETIRRLIQLVNSLDEEQKRAAKEGLSEDELALFDLLQSARARQTYRSFAPPPHDRRPAHP